MRADHAWGDMSAATKIIVGDGVICLLIDWQARWMSVVRGKRMRHKRVDLSSIASGDNHTAISERFYLLKRDTHIVAHKRQTLSQSDWCSFVIDPNDH